MLIQSIRNKAFALLAVTALACGGCHHSDDPCPPEEPAAPTPAPETVNLCLKVSFEGQEGSTRADNDPSGYEGPDLSKNYEKVNYLRVIIIRCIPQINEEGDTIKDDTGKPVTDRMLVEANKLVGTNEYGYPKAGSLDFEVVDHEIKFIYLIANESSLKSPIEGKSTLEFLRDNYKVGTEITGFKELEEWTASIPDVPATGVVTNGIFSDPQAGITMRPLPMTEFFEIFVNVRTKYKPDDTYYSDLFMTRTAAKASFYLDPDGLASYKGIKITSISLFGIGSKEYVFPNNTEYSTGKYVADQNNVERPNPSVENMYITSFDTPTDNLPITYLINKEIDMVPAEGSLGTERRQITDPIYFPASILEKDQHYYVTVTLSTGVELTAPLTTNILKIDRDGFSCDAVARNTHLKIVLKFTPPVLNCEAILLPYTGVWLNPEFGI